MVKLASELEVDDVLGNQGILQQYIDGYQTRESQLNMAELIMRCIRQGENHVIEASTGIGKSFAYLVPAFLSAHKILISTGTKNLQDQLFYKDIPLINKTIVSGKQLALLKGRSNYCCPYRINKHRQQRRFQTRQLAPVFDALVDWSQTSLTGDIAEFADIPENDSLWFYATSNTDNCLGGDCPEFSKCFVIKARRKAMDADVVVINHHLFFSDQALREEGFGELLPDVDVLIFDEAHQLPDVASHFFGRSITLRQFDLLMREIVEAQVKEARDSSDIQPLCDSNKKQMADFRLLLGKFVSKGEWKHIRHAPEIRKAMENIQQEMVLLLEQLEVLKPRGKELAACYSRLDGYRQSLNDFEQESSNSVSWYEWNEHSFRLMISPIEIADEFSQQLLNSSISSVFFTSATLSSNHSFDYFTRRLGLPEIECASFDSPFDYQKQSMLYLPENMPDPNNDNYLNVFIEECTALIKATEGNTFILFTSYRMLSLTANMLRKRVKYPLFIQGEMQRSELLQAYLKTPNAILLGTSSFWEGIDVKGERLKLVIIDKLPFKSPGDPVYKRRLQKVSEQGGNAFNDVQIPEAIIALRQGVGRLIRDANDRGIVMIADNRLTAKNYGKNILNSLPDMPISSSRSQVLTFATSL
jgi:ATP-dependent DNA helicase DinG